MWRSWSSSALLATLVTILVNGALVGSSSSSSSSPSDATSCQCGVFLLGAPPLQFSEDAKPVLAGDPVSTNCTSPKDRTECSTICRRLVQSMDNPKSPLFQAVVLTASRTLACQRYNSSTNMKVPLPRIHMNNPWTRNIGGSANNKRETGTSLAEGEPKWLGGFYRWCDVHWIYAGASVHEPLCCANGLPTKCPESANSAFPAPEVRSSISSGNTKPFVFSTNRNPRLIIKKRPEDDISEEEMDDEEDVGGGEQENDLTETSSPSSTATTNVADDDETNTANENDNQQSFEKIDPLKVIAAATTEDPSSKLNSTILAEAFSWVGAIMRTLGMGDVTDGIKTVLPTSTATELLKKVDVGGWVGKYQDQYVKFTREYNLGYCYLEYGLYNVASEGVGNMISRVFSTTSSNNGNSLSPMSSMSSINNNVLNDLGGVNGHGHGFGLNTNYIKTYHRRGRRSTSNADSAALFHDAVGQGQFETVSNVTASKPTKIHITTPHRSQVEQGQKTKSARRQQPSNGPNLMNMANMLLQMAAGSGDNGGGGGGGDNVNALLQNALPFVGQVATSPMIQGVVSNLVTSFLTPPEPSNNNFNKRPPPPAKTGLDDNEIEERPPKRPTQQQNQPPPGQQESGLTSMLGQIVQTYLKHYFSSGNSNPPKSPPPPSRPSPSSKPTKNSATTTTPATPVAEERTDIVETISEVAKPFFLSYFGVVPGAPGYGQLSVADRTGRDTLSYDPDPGTSLTDLVFGSVNIPTTGNSVFDFGNRISFAFGRANDPTQGLFCAKQYTVNKLWDGFRFVVKTLFK